MPDVNETDRKSPNPGRPLGDLRDTGLLWLINRVVFHPRGYAFALHYDEDPRTNPDAQCTGWSLLGDGSETWTYGPTPEGVPTEDELLARVNALLAPRTPPPIVDPAGGGAAAVHCSACDDTGMVTVGDGDYEGASCHDEPCPTCTRGTGAA